VVHALVPCWVPARFSFRDRVILMTPETLFE